MYIINIELLMFKIFHIFKLITKLQTMKKSLTLLFLLIPLLLNCQIHFQADDFKKLEDSLAKIMFRNKIPGMQMAIVSKDSVLHISNLGYANIKDSLMVTDQTLFRIGSVTKSFVAVSTMQLVEQGKIKLNSKLKDIAPEVPYENKWEETAPIQLDNIMEHTTGFDDLHAKEYATQGDGWTTLQGLQYHPNGRYTRWKPNMHMSYCNAGPPIAAFMLEKITGKTIEAYIDENIFKPLNMNNSSLMLTENVKKNLSQAYINNQFDTAPYWHIIDRSAGAINSNATEMANYLMLYLNRGKFDTLQLLSPESIERIEHPKTTLAAKAGAKEGYGLYMGNGIYKGIKTCGHTGGMNGFLTNFRYMPEQGVGFVFIINRSRTNGFSKIGQLLTDFLIPDSLVKTADEMATNTELSLPVTGWYRSATSRNQMTRFFERIAQAIKITEEDGKYYRKEILKPRKPLYNYTQNSLLFESERHSISPYVFIEEEGEMYLQVAAFSQNYKKTSGFSVWGTIIIGFLGLLFMVSAIPAALIWIPMSIFSKKKYRYLKTRIASLTAVLALLGMALCFMLMDQTRAIEILGNSSFWSVSIFIFSLLFAIQSIYAFIIGLISFKRPMNKAARIYYLLIATSCFVFTLYLWYWEIIGLQTWTY